MCTFLCSPYCLLKAGVLLWLPQLLVPQRVFTERTRKHWFGASQVCSAMFTKVFVSTHACTVLHTANSQENSFGFMGSTSQWNGFQSQSQI